MPELRDLLNNAAGQPRDLPDVEMIMRRARPRQIRRRVGVAVAATLVAATALGGVVVVTRSDSPDVIQPAPFPGSSQGAPIREGQLEPGTYRGELAGRGFVLDRSDDEWGVLTADPQWLALTHRQYLLHLQQWSAVVPPESEDAGRTEPAPADLARWLESNPRLSVQNRTPVVVGGLEGIALDVRVVQPLSEAPVECISKCVVLATISGTTELVDVAQGERARFIVLGDSGEQFVLAYRAREREFPVLEQAADQLLSGLRFDGS